MQPDEIEHILISLIASTCDLPIKAIDKTLPILELGIESMVAITLNAQVIKELNVELPFDEIANNASICDVALFIHQEKYKNITTTPTYQSPIQSTQEKVPNKKNTNNIKKLPQYKRVTLRKTLFKKADVELPYYRSFESASIDTICYQDQTLINFSSYNYLGFNADPRVNQAAKEAIDHYGTSAASSRIVSGEKPIHRTLEAAIADLYQVDDALVFVSGYATNVSVISHLMEKNDLIIHDELAHNSIVTGCSLSQAKRFKFPHNDVNALEDILKLHRANYDRVLIVIEGLYSMDGDTAPLAKIVELKKQYQCLLMVDEAHSIGVLGEKGLGLREHEQVKADDVDIWMGTLSKSFAGCGGYIAGCWELIDYIKYTAPGFIFSVGLAPPLAGASLKAIELLKESNERVLALKNNSQYFLACAKQCGYNTGHAEGYAIIPIILGHSLNTAQFTNYLFNQGINVQPIIYPGVDESSARLRFFISALHTTEQIDKTFKILKASNLRSPHEYHHTSC